MNREEFMRQLESLLQDLPGTEREKAIQYYNEYFEDAGPENEKSVIEALGNPARVAGNVKKNIFGNGYEENHYMPDDVDYMEIIPYSAGPGAGDATQEQSAWKSENLNSTAQNGTTQNGAAQTQTVTEQKKDGMSTGMIVLIILLCILASPVILGVASAGIGTAAGLIAGWFGLIIGFGITAVVLLLVLIGLVIAGMISLFHNPFVGMGLIGAGLICGGVGLLFLMLTVAMAGIATPAICHWIGSLFQKGSKQKTARQPA